MVVGHPMVVVVVVGCTMVVVVGGPTTSKYSTRPLYPAF